MFSLKSETENLSLFLTWRTKEKKRVMNPLTNTIHWIWTALVEQFYPVTNPHVNPSDWFVKVYVSIAIIIACGTKSGQRSPRKYGLCLFPVQPWSGLFVVWKQMYQPSVFFDFCTMSKAKLLLNLSANHEICSGSALVIDLIECAPESMGQKLQ